MDYFWNFGWKIKFNIFTSFYFKIGSRLVETFKEKNSDPLFSLVPPTSKNHNFFKNTYFDMKSFLEQR